MPGTYRALLVLGWGLPAPLGAGKDLAGLCFPPPSGAPFRDAALQGQAPRTPGPPGRETPQIPVAAMVVVDLSADNLQQCRAAPPGSC